MSNMLSKQSVDLKTRLFRGFSDRTRLCILEALRDHPLTVTEIVDLTGLSQSNVSNHLACLRGCGLVSCEQRGRYVDYQLSDPRIDSILLIVEELLSEIGSHIYECTRYRSRQSIAETFPEVADNIRRATGSDHQPEVDCAEADPMGLVSPIGP